jgi:signal transduction histidine kinase
MVVRYGAMKEAPPVWTNKSATQRAARIDSTVEPDVCDLGIVVFDEAGRLVSANLQARALLAAESPSALEARLIDLRAGLPVDFSGGSDEATVEVSDVGPIGVRRCHVAGVSGEGQVLLLRDGRVSEDATRILQEAARHRAFAFLARDWAHDLKGMLHVIRINTALLDRLLQRSPGVADAAVTKCLDAIPRQVEHLDRSIEVMFSARVDEQQSTVDVSRVCERLRSLVAPRATRQRVELVLEVSGGSKEIRGFEDQVQLALLNVLLNALEAMPEQGRLVISADGHANGVTVRVSDSGAGMPPQPDTETWRARFVNDPRRTGIGLHVARAIVESHHGRIECASNVPRGTSVEITFPSAASTERLRHGSRTHR